MLVLHHPVIQDLWNAINDEELSDISLIANDGEVPANRFVLAARSNVLKKMLYGPFLESQSQKIPLYEFDKVTLEAIVEYCCKNEIPKFRLFMHTSVLSARRLVQLFKAADYLQLMGLAKLVSQMAHNLTTRFPPLACAVYDEADIDTKISNDSLLMIQCRPYVTFPPDNETGGGIDQLSCSKILSIYKDKDVKAGELFLFQMLQKWMHLNDEEHPDTVDVAKTCASFIQLENIEPQDLLGKVMKSGLCSEKKITEAITQQALRASQNRVWSLSSRGPDIERILVEGAGSKDTNGIYYKIDGLTNGELYSKREVACGQQHVYTLSVSLSKGKQVECRIFCSKLLTHNAVIKMARSAASEPTFQPILQIIRIFEEAVQNEEKGGANASRKAMLLQLSDGEHFITAALNPRFATSKKTNQLIQNTLIKVLNYDRTVHDGKRSFQINKLSIVSHDPGHRFGNPAYYFDVFDEHDEEEQSNAIIQNSSTPIENQIFQKIIKQPEDEDGSANVTLSELYSCQYPLSEKPIDSKIPNVGWQIDSHGVSPGPKCQWIPPSTEQEKSSVLPNVTATAISGSTQPEEC